MPNATSKDIEWFLFDKGNWVSGDVIYSLFDISERRLRKLGKGFLVARAGGGYIHSFHATPDEIKAYCVPKRKHAVGEYLATKELMRNYRERRRPYPDPAAEQSAQEMVS